MSNGRAVPQFLKRFGLGLVAFALANTLGGCDSGVTFEKIDRKGHVRIVQGEQGYCFKVPQDWEIREKLEGADVVCLAPLADGFRDSIVARSLPSSALENPEETVRTQLEALGTKVTVLEPWSGPDRPVVVTLEESRFSKEPLAQLLYIHLKPEGNGVLIACTTTTDKLEATRPTFDNIVGQAKYDLTDCPGEGGLPKVFPTPEVTLRPL